jgi:hypothetical protein
MKIRFVILNIFTWQTLSHGNEYFGSLLLCKNEDTNIWDIGTRSINLNAEKYSITRKITFDEACILDEKDIGDSYRLAWENGERETIRFNCIDAITKAGITMFSKLGLHVPLISLFEGKRFAETVILNNPTDKEYLPRWATDIAEELENLLTPGSDNFDKDFADAMKLEHGSIKNCIKAFWRLAGKRNYDFLADEDEYSGIIIGESESNYN